MVVKQATAGMTGCDVNQQLSTSECLSLAKEGFQFVIRYIPRLPELMSGNLTKIEITTIQSAGLALGAVQHCPSPGWLPNAALGEQYGNFAGWYAENLGLSRGMHIWLDLEGVAKRSSDLDVIAYCNAWFNSVAQSGYIPAIYIGYGTNLSNLQLFANLKFKSYWRAYNADQQIPTRGYCMIQHPQKEIAGIMVDPDTIQADQLGGLPFLLYP